MEHTALPWKVSNSMDFITVDNQTHAPICRMAYKGIWDWAAEVGSLEDKANAEFIVRACNSYYDLLNLCKQAHEDLRDIINATDNDQPYSAKEMDKNFSATAGNLYDEIRKHKPNFE